jgi:hypothetical protein
MLKAMKATVRVTCIQGHGNRLCIDTSIQLEPRLQKIRFWANTLLGGVQKKKHTAVDFSAALSPFN